MRMILLEDIRLFGLFIIEEDAGRLSAAALLLP